MRTILLTLLAAVSSQIILIAGKASDETTAAYGAVTIIIGAVAADWTFTIKGFINNRKNEKNFIRHWGAKNHLETSIKNFAAFKGHF